jgi:hypothetical protein
MLDKICKAMITVLEATEAIAKWQGGSDELINGIGNGREGFKVTRDFLGLFNIFNGVIPALYSNVRHAVLLAHNVVFTSDEIYALKPIPDKINGVSPVMKHNEVAINFWEKIIVLIEQVGKGLGALTFIVGFGFLKPVANYEKYINQNINETASKIGKAFPTAMKVNHISGFIGNGAALIFNNLAYNRAQEAIQQITTQKDSEVYYEKMVENGVGFVLKGLETVNDFLPRTAPKWVCIPLNLAIAGFGITKEVIKK